MYLSILKNRAWKPNPSVGRCRYLGNAPHFSREAQFLILLKSLASHSLLRNTSWNKTDGSYD